MSRDKYLEFLFLLIFFVFLGSSGKAVPIVRKVIQF